QEVLRSALHLRAFNIHFSFFFSGIRRHTSSKRDWSSDVCSSDLVLAGGFQLRRRSEDHCGVGRSAEGGVLGDQLAGAQQLQHLRSEERRVGKESRTQSTAKAYSIEKRLSYTKEQ